MKLSKKRARALKLIKYFIQPEWNFNKCQPPEYNSFTESPDGVEPVQAFFDFTERGIYPKVVTSKQEYLSLLYGHRWMTAHEKMWREGFQEGTLHPLDFKDEDVIVLDMAKECCLSVVRKWL